MAPQLFRQFTELLARTERLDAAALRSHQIALLAKLAAHARGSTGFYKDRIDCAGLPPPEIERAWRKIPILTRAEVTAKSEALLSKCPPPQFGAAVDGRTTGSTGAPLAFKISSAQLASCRALTERMFRWWGVDGGKTFAQISYDRAGLSPTALGASGRGWHSLAPDGASHFLSVAFDIDTQLDWLIDQRPNYLVGYSGVLKELAGAAQKRGVKLKFDLIFSIATMVDEEARGVCRSVFGAEIADTYGAQETGHIAAQCPECGEYHISAETVFVEILRDDGTPAAGGETGRVIATPLYNYAMPFIRYEVGDLAEFGTADPACSRKMPTLRRIFGRYRNLFRFRDGTMLWPSDSKFALSDFSIRQFQVVQRDLDHIEIRHVAGAADPPIDLAALTARVQSALGGQKVEVSLAPVAKIERSRSGKFESYITLVA